MLVALKKKKCVLTNRDGLCHGGWCTGASIIRCYDPKDKWSTVGILLIESQFGGIQHEATSREGWVIVTSDIVDYFHVVCGRDVWGCVSGRIPANGDGI